MLKKYTPTVSTKQHSYLGQSDSSPIMCILPLQRSRFMKFEFVRPHNQSCTFHFLIDLFVTYMFYIHTWHGLMEAARCNKNGVQQSVPWSVGCSLSDVMSALHGSPNQPIRHNQKHWSVPEGSFLGWKLRSSQLLVKYVWTVWPIFSKLYEDFAKLYEDPA